MEIPFNSREFQNAIEKFSSPTVQNEEKINRKQLIQLIEKFALQQSSNSFRSLERGFSLSKKSSNSDLIKDTIILIKHYIIDNLSDEEKKASFKKNPGPLAKAGTKLLQ